MDSKSLYNHTFGKVKGNLNEFKNFILAYGVPGTWVKHKSFDQIKVTDQIGKFNFNLYKNGTFLVQGDEEWVKIFVETFNKATMKEKLRKNFGFEYAEKTTIQFSEDDFFDIAG
ncbi:hypothetical protein LEP1GSC050_4155 [Leptospira broomii serovar Hurstbridge str. 5399]|uniref:Uncharacterized protein n=1 Tax=Leptospira broomii serovar Hurstbridge str. 5399 TaxID=1049789 RepID=T0FAT1_9LEPT|nr:hypothetical protein [Leptospira broomii]EQA44652.1 hypothetical protein LEP1GSC050_4155 [Leptospira broomii serovar Hurstbridge str. 5399]